jgi:hypothetical protein
MPNHVGDDPEHDVGYPPYVVTPEDEHRWDLCEKMSEDLFADLEPAQRREQVWSATRAMYHSDIPT